VPVGKVARNCGGINGESRGTISMKAGSSVANKVPTVMSEVPSKMMRLLLSLTHPPVSHIGPPEIGDTRGIGIPKVNPAPPEKEPELVLSRMSARGIVNAAAPGPPP
jgi:hypothetical protein